MSQIEEPDFYQWTDQALVVDAVRLTAAGPEVVRVTITKQRLKAIVGNDPEIARWFLQSVVGGVKQRVGTQGFSPDLLRNAQALQKTLSNPDGLFTKPTRADAILGPEILALEQQFGLNAAAPVALAGHVYTVGPGGDVETQASIPTIKGKVHGAVIGGTQRPYILRDQSQKRIFMPLFTTRLAFAEFAENCPPGTTLERVEFASIGAFISRVRPTLKLALDQGLTYVALNHPGPMKTAHGVTHLEVAALIEVPDEAIEVEVQYG